MTCFHGVAWIKQIINCSPRRFNGMLQTNAKTNKPREDSVVIMSDPDEGL